ncbi:nucleoside deaminase [Sphingomonas panni]
MNEADIDRLARCVELAGQAVEAGDQPFGSMIVSSSGEVLFEDRNREGGGDPTSHPELAVVRWAIANLSPSQRRSATVYTSGEHCAMCSAAHGLAGLGRIVYATSTSQLDEWLSELGRPTLPIASLRITDVLPDADVSGPEARFADVVRELHARAST